MTEGYSPGRLFSDTERIRALEKENAKLREERDVFAQGCENILPTRHAGNPLLSLSKTIAPGILGQADV